MRQVPTECSATGDSCPSNDIAQTMEAATAATSFDAIVIDDDDDVVSIAEPEMEAEREPAPTEAELAEELEQDIDDGAEEINRDEVSERPVLMEENTLLTDPNLTRAQASVYAGALLPRRRTRKMHRRKDGIVCLHVRHHLTTHAQVPSGYREVSRVFFFCAFLFHLRICHAADIPKAIQGGLQAPKWCLYVSLRPLLVVEVVRMVCPNKQLPQDLSPQLRKQAPQTLKRFRKRAAEAI